VYGSLLLACNTDRLLVYALPVLLPVAVANLRCCLDRARSFGLAVLTTVGLARAGVPRRQKRRSQPELR
jgi:hypothetical protein